MTHNQEFLNQALALAVENVKQGGRPFGAVVVKNSVIIASGVNRIRQDSDPTAHAELLALREAGKVLQTTRLDECTVYASGQPCPMCLAAMRLAGVKKIIFAYSNDQAEPFGLSTADVSSELSLPLEQQSWAFIEHCPPETENTPHLYELWHKHSSATP
ncbi:MAG: nucleoside deaminase [Pseudomonadales bacterium]